MLVKRFVRDFKLEIEVLLFVFGIILLMIGATGILMPEGSPDFLKSIHEDLGGWVYWLALAGALMILVGGFYMVDNLLKRREFERLMKTDSKAKFVKDKERIEYLAWILTSDHEKRLWEKKKEFGMKT